MLREGQLHAVCHALCVRSGLARRGVDWTRDGPSSQAGEVLTGDFPCSTGERLIVEVAFAVWNNYTKNIAPIGPMLGTLSGHHIVAIGQLIMALGLSEEDDGEAVAEWIERQPRKWFIDVRPAK